MEFLKRIEKYTVSIVIASAASSLCPQWNRGNFRRKTFFRRKKNATFADESVNIIRMIALYLKCTRNQIFLDRIEAGKKRLFEKIHNTGTYS